MNYQNKDIFIVYTLDSNRQPYLKRAYYNLNEAQANLQYGEFVFNTPIQLMIPQSNNNPWLNQSTVFPPTQATVFPQAQATVFPPAQTSVFPPPMTLTPQAFPPQQYQHTFPQQTQFYQNPFLLQQQNKNSRKDVRM